MKKFTILMVLGICFLETAFTYDEMRVRHIMADISCGGPISYYEGHMDESHVAEAVKRWKNGVRVVNASSFDRVILNGKWTIVYKGTTRAINSADVRLTTDRQQNTYDEMRVRHIMADISCGGPISYYEGHMDESHVAEAVKRWKNGVRVVNASSFDRVILNGKWTIVYKGTTRAINSADVRLTTDR